MAAAKRPRSEGAIRLGKVSRTDEELAARLGCKREQVNYWKTGARVPGTTWRIRMRDELGIPLEAWDQFPKGKASTPERKPPRSPDAEAPPPADYELPADDGTVRAKAARLDRLVRSMLDVIEREQRRGDAGTLTVVEGFKLATDAHRLLDKLGRLTGESAQMPESRILRLPQWRRIQARVLEALAPHPKALAAVVRELEELGGEV